MYTVAKPDPSALKRRLTLSLAVILLSFPLIPTVAASDRCLSASRWAQRSVNDLVRSAHTAYLSDGLDTYYALVGRLLHTMKRCGPDRDVVLTAEYPELVGYLNESSYATLPSHELGFNVPDKQYLVETARFVSIPSYLLDQKFLHDVSRWETLWRAKRYLENLNSQRSPGSQLIFFSYISRHLGTPDNDDSYRRLLVVVPGEDGEPDKWVQFGVTDPRVRVRTRNVSIVSAVVRGDGSYDAYFRDMFRVYSRNGSIGLKGRFELGEGEDNCASCHKSGVLPIFPEPGSVGSGEEERVEAVNERFRSYGAPEFGGYLDPAKFGPGLAFATEQHRSAKFGPAFNATVVAQAMSCNRCHTPEKLGYLNWPMDRVIIGSFVKGGEMPRGSHLSSAHRADLYKKLIDEYFDVSDTNPGTMKSWLLGRMR